MNTENISAVILAAGTSSRMGAFKPLLNLNGITLLERNIRLFQSVGIDDILVVTGHNKEALEPLVHELGGRPIFNKEFASGMLSSIQAGVKALEYRPRSFFLQPVDIPLVRKRTVSRLIHACEKGEYLFYHPVFQDHKGHPTLFSIDMAERIITYQGIHGLHLLLREYAHKAFPVPVIDERILLDADCPQDLEFLSRLEAESPLLSHNEWQALMAHFQVPQETIAHCRKVAEIAFALGCALTHRGVKLDIHLIEAAARVHDLAKGQKYHADKGADLLREMGMASLADIVRCHTDMDPIPRGPVTEAEVVFLADKLVSGTDLVPIEERFKKTTNRFRNKEAAIKSIIKRHKMTCRIRSRIEENLSTPINQVLKMSS